MPEIQPFRGIRYRVADALLPRVLCPPYDVIPPAYQEELYLRDERNVVRIVLNRKPAPAAYEEAGATFRGWLAAGLMAPDPEPSLYLVAQGFEAEGVAHTRWGILARFRVEDYGRRVVLPHEQTRKGPKEDRYQLLKATRANFSPIFLMFPDAQGGFAALAEGASVAPPDAAYTDDGGVAHRLWRLTDPGTLSALRSRLGSVPAYIADGHHRYATALRYRDETGPAGAWTLGYFTPLEAPGLVVLPYHRLLDGGPSLDEARARLAGPRFTVTDVAGAAGAARGAAASRAPWAFGIAEPGGRAVVVEAGPEAADLLDAATPASLRVLDTYFLHQGVLQKVLGVGDDVVRYAHSLSDAEEALAAAACRTAVLVRPTPVGQIVAVAEAGESMPAKSTFFHPKLPSGLVIHPLD